MVAIGLAQLIPIGLLGDGFGRLWSISLWIAYDATPTT